MARFMKFGTQPVDEACPRASLSDVEYVVLAGQTRIGGWLGSDEEVDVGVPDVVDGYWIGFTWEQSGSYAAVADWSELKHRGIRKGEFVGRVSHLYGVQATLRTMEPQGFVVAERTSQADGSVRIVMRRVA